MRVVRFFTLLLGLALTAAGCAPQPVAYMSYPSPAVAGPSHGIDSVVYGTGGPYVPPPATAAATGRRNIRRRSRQHPLSWRPGQWRRPR